MFASSHRFQRIGYNYNDTLPDKGMITYIARNTLNGKFYIGSSLDFKKRKRQHLESTFNYPFQNALRENPDVFEWEVYTDDSNGRELEQALLDMFFGTEMCYNLSPYAQGGSDFKPYGYFWINNGQEEKFINSWGDLDQGNWKEGRLSVKTETRKKMSEKLIQREDNPFKRKGDESMSHGRVWITTPERDQERYLKPEEEIPQGWVRGRMKRAPRDAESRVRTSVSLKRFHSQKNGLPSD